MDLFLNCSCRGRKKYFKQWVAYIKKEPTGSFFYGFESSNSVILRFCGECYDVWVLEPLPVGLV